MAPISPTPGFGTGPIGSKNPQLVCRQLAMPSVWHNDSKRGPCCCPAINNPPEVLDPRFPLYRVEAFFRKEQ